MSNEATITIDEQFFYDLLMLMVVQKDMHAMSSSGMLDMNKLQFQDGRLLGYAKDQQRIINEAREVGFELWRRNKEARLGHDWWKQEPKIKLPKSHEPPSELARYKMPSQLKEIQHYV